MQYIIRIIKKKAVGMMKNNKGFTLVEILVVIVLISLILGLGIPGIMKLRENMNKRSLNSKINIVESAAVVWGNDNKTLLKKTICKIDKLGYDCYKLSLGNLIEEDYLPSESVDKISYINPSNKEELINNCIYIYKKNNKVYSYLAIDDKSCIYKPRSEITDPEGATPDTTLPEDVDDGVIRIPDESQPDSEKKLSGPYIPDYSYQKIVYCDNECVEPGNVCSKEEIQNGIYCQVSISDLQNSSYNPKVMNFHVLKNTDNVLYLMSDGLLYDENNKKNITLTNPNTAHTAINKITATWNNLNNDIIYQEALGYYKNKKITVDGKEYAYNAIIPTYEDLKEILLDNSAQKLPYWTAYYHYDSNKTNDIWLNGTTSQNGPTISDTATNADECNSIGGYYGDDPYASEGYACQTGSGSIAYGCIKPSYDSSKLDYDCFWNSYGSLDNYTTKIILPIKKNEDKISSVSNVIDVNEFYNYINNYTKGAGTAITSMNVLSVTIDDAIWGKKTINMKYFLYENNLYISNIYVNKVFLYENTDSSQSYGMEEPGMECKFYYNDKELEFESMFKEGDATCINNTEILYRTTSDNLAISSNKLEKGEIKYVCHNNTMHEHADGGYYVNNTILSEGTLNF